MIRGWSIGRSCLFILVFQNLLYILFMRYARSRSSDPFLPSSMMVLSEAVKFVTCLCILYRQKTLRGSLSSIAENPLDSFKSCIPALIYLVQNRLLVAALSTLDAATFQVTYQLKLLTTALFSVSMLRKPISPMQWFSLFLLFVGVVVVDPPSSTKPDEMNISQNPTVGLAYVLCASLLSGFSSIYFEMLLKNSSKSLWLRNIELAGTSLVVGFIAQLLFEWTPIQRKGYFHGFDWVVWLLIGLHSFGGLTVAMVVKYANNMLKGFACSVSIVLSCLFSILFLDVTLSWSFLFGALLVVVSVVTYAIYPPKSIRARC